MGKSDSKSRLENPKFIPFVCGAALENVGDLPSRGVLPPVLLGLKAATLYSDIHLWSKNLIEPASDLES